MVYDRIIKGAGVSVIFLCLMAACGNVGGSGQCGGAEETGSCLRVEKIEPKDKNETTSNVDAFQSICNLSEVNNATPPGSVAPVFETFTDHSAEITLSNRPLQDLKKADISDITIVNYAIVYTLNRCPDGASCPGIPLQVVKPGQTTIVLADGSTTFTLPFVPLAAKLAYSNAGGSKSDVPSYTATYTLTGTDSFGNAVSAVGSAEFTISDFNTCS